MIPDKTTLFGNDKSVSINHYLYAKSIKSVVRLMAEIIHEH